MKNYFKLKNYVGVMLTAVALASSGAQATTVSIDSGIQQTNGINSTRTVVGVQEGNLGIKVTYAIIDRVEADYTVVLTDNIAVKGGLGLTANSTMSPLTYSVTPEFKMKVGAATLYTSYQFRNDVRSIAQDLTRTAQVGVSYSLSPKLDLGVKYMDISGKTEE